jgi:hypothetical protein
MPLSRTSKLDGVRSWSLQAGTTCPGSRDGNGDVVPVCQACYAKSGNYVFSHVKKTRLENDIEWKSDTWVSDMVAALDNSRYFRWFDSGDMYHIKLVEKIYEIMVATPWVKHWLPTKMAKFAKFQPIIAKMQALPNVMVRFSSDSLVGEYSDCHGSTVIPSKESADNHVKVCLAYENPKHNCNGCRACWDKDVKVIAYVAHGAKAKGMLRKHFELAKAA